MRLLRQLEAKIIMIDALEDDEKPAEIRKLALEIQSYYHQRRLWDDLKRIESLAGRN